MARSTINLKGNKVIADEFEGAAGQTDLQVTIAVELESAGEAITIPAGSTLAEALQIIIDAVDP